MQYVHRQSSFHSGVEAYPSDERYPGGSLRISEPRNTSLAAEDVVVCTTLG